MPLTTTFNHQSVGPMRGDTALCSLGTFEASHLYTPSSTILVLLKRTSQNWCWEQWPKLFWRRKDYVKARTLSLKAHISNVQIFFFWNELALLHNSAAVIHTTLLKRLTLKDPLGHYQCYLLHYQGHLSMSDPQ